MINLDNHGKPPKKSISLSFGGYSSGTWSYPSILTGVTGCIRCGSPSTTILVKLSAHERWYECKNQSCTVRYYKTIIATGESKIVELKDAAVNAKIAYHGSRWIIKKADKSTIEEKAAMKSARLEELIERLTIAERALLGRYLQG